MSNFTKSKKRVDPATKADIMRYTPNSLSFWLCVLAIVLDVIMFLIIYRQTDCVPNYLLGIDLIINVVYMLAGFLLDEKQKAYLGKFGYFSIGLGIIEILRIFCIPLYYYLKHVEYIKEYNLALESGTEFVFAGIKGLPTKEFIWCVAIMVLSGICLILAGVFTIIKEKKLIEYKNNLGGTK